MEKETVIIRQRRSQAEVLRDLCMENDKKIPRHEQPLDEGLSLVELIRSLNADREILRANHSLTALQWSDIDDLCNEIVEST
jgi:hypothetical protein